MSLSIFHSPVNMPYKLRTEFILTAEREEKQRMEAVITVLTLYTVIAHVCLFFDHCVEQVRRDAQATLVEAHNCYP